MNFLRIAKQSISLLVISFVGASLAWSGSKTLELRGGGRGKMHDEVVPRVGVERENRSVVSIDTESWDAQFGGVQRGGMDAAFRLGFPEMPQMMFMYGLSNKFAIGGSFGVGLGTNYPRVAPLMQIGVPMRLQLGSHPKLSVGLSLTPSFILGFTGPVPAFGFDTHFKLGGRIHSRVLLGIGADIPLSIGAVGGVVAFGLPILFGPELEVRLIRPMSFVFESLFGPLIAIADAGAGPSAGVVFGMKINAGVNYHF
jgi:hypothetical protein